VHSQALRKPFAAYIVDREIANTPQLRGYSNNKIFSTCISLKHSPSVSKL